MRKGSAREERGVREAGWGGVGRKRGDGEDGEEVEARKERGAAIEVPAVLEQHRSESGSRGEEEEEEEEEERYTPSEELFCSDCRAEAARTSRSSLSTHKNSNAAIRFIIRDTGSSHMLNPACLRAACPATEVNSVLPARASLTGSDLFHCAQPTCSQRYCSKLHSSFLAYLHTQGGSGRGEGVGGIKRRRRRMGG